jgi:hypothetical protein
VWIDNKFYKIKKLLENEAGTLIDFGARDQILKKFINKNIEYTGVDIANNITVNNLIMNLNKEIPFNENSYDFVTACDIAEHLEEPKIFIEKCIKISKNKTIIVLPNVAYYETRFKFFLKGNLGNKYHFSGKKEDDRHHWFTNYYNIKNFINKNFNNFTLVPIYKTRNKLKLLLNVEKLLSKFFPNLFIWSLMIVINKKK